MEVEITIDSITNCLVSSDSGEEFDTEYRRIEIPFTKEALDELKRNGWKFDWERPFKEGYLVYALYLKAGNEIQGLIALKHVSDQLFTEIDIVEASPVNVGRRGKFKGVGAHLFAIACKLSWDAGNEGYVQFIAKTNLIEHYTKTVYAKLIGSQVMIIDSYGAIQLINKYFKEVER